MSFMDCKLNWTLAIGLMTSAAGLFANFLVEPSFQHASAYTNFIHCILIYSGCMCALGTAANWQGISSSFSHLLTRSAKAITVGIILISACVLYSNFFSSPTIARVLFALILIILSMHSSLCWPARRLETGEMLLEPSNLSS